jgi:hypothetical protein
MKKERKLSELDMRRYDWSKAQRGRFANRLRPVTEPVAVRIIDADLEAAFPDSESMNNALRLLVQVARVAPLKKVRRSVTRTKVA